jgi:hypothetical protein
MIPKPSWPTRGLASVPAISLFLVIAWLPPAPCQAQSVTPEQRSSGSDHPDESDWFAMLLAANVGGGFDANAPRQPTAYTGIKVGISCCIAGKHPRETGRTVTLDLGYDRLRSNNGFSAELSTMLPIVRFPRPSNDPQNYLRIYAGPAGGFRAGAGDIGLYASAKLVVALLSNRRIFAFKTSPIVEIQHRFPFATPMHGDLRLTVGMMVALCKHCGLD